MEIKIPQPQLLEVLELVSRVSTKHVTLPVLQCVLLEVKGGVLHVRSTNLEVGIEATLAVEADGDDTVAVPATTLLQTVQLAPKGDLVLRTEEGNLVIEVKNGETSINTIPYDEFPTIPRVEGKGQVINRSLFSLGIKTAAFAA